MDNKIYYFDKAKKYYEPNDKYVFYGHLLGEIQSNFNMSQVIDGTKDSMACQVHSFNGNCIEPWTIIWHKDNDTWWVVSHDRVERHANESGFYYIHNLELLGAIELLNARDLTDCAFNQDKYTIAEVINRLFALSNFDLDFEIEQEADINAYRLVLDHIKTFENYTLLTALRELLDEYNCAPKLSFYEYEYEDGEYFIDFADLQIKSKTGFVNGTVIEMDSEFNSVNENKTIDKNSFGSCVVSNADNVVSTLAKTYPSIGAVRLSSTEWNITTDNAILRLPTNVFKANWVKIVSNMVGINGSCGIGGTNYWNNVANILYKANPSMPFTIKKALQDVCDYVYATAIDRGYNEFANDFKTHFEARIETLADNLVKASTTTIYEGNNINATTGNIVKGANVPYIAQIDISDNAYVYRDFILTNKEGRDMLKYKNQGLYWDRGSDRIEGFKGMTSVPISGFAARIAIKDHLSTDYNSNALTLFTEGNVGDTAYFELSLEGGNIEIPFRDAQFIVNYIPMNDIKIKIDNDAESRDIQLYNQNGKLTDSVALSKLLNSHAKEISSDNITRYGIYYDYDSIPDVGQIFSNNGEDYVINNISYDFYQNDDSGYYVECEFTMSKAVAVKSMLVNPNTNVRDYGIPQSFNVKRKQVYRDYYELTYRPLPTANQETPYLATEKVFTFVNNTYAENDFICQMGIIYAEQINGYNYWCYQLETTTYILNKSRYIVCDFKDNNIIGYGFMNMYGGFDVTRLFDPTVSVNTPISYVDSKGNFKDIKLEFLTPQQLEDNIIAYKSDVGHGSDNTPIYNASCFIDSLLFQKAENNHSIEIYEEFYNKDALEVPVFEFGYQFGNSKDVKFGDSVLNEHKGCVYFYSFVVGDGLTENNTFNDNEITDFASRIYTLEDAVNIEYDNQNHELRITLYETQSYDKFDGTTENNGQVSIPYNKDLAIFRYALDMETAEVYKELLFICKKVSLSAIENNTLILKVNHWKLK